jgi:haloalkane dehalogenase
MAETIAAAMSWDLDERLALRFPDRSRQVIARVLALPPNSQVRRRLLTAAFRTHSGTSHPASGVFRTPEERFEGLPDFLYEPNYRNVGDLRLAHMDVGEGAPVLMLHGEPAWSFIWRKLIPPIRDAGYRCVAPDHVGFGRSDKPTDPTWQSFQRHVELTGSLLEDLDLREVTLVVHDWGGPIGLTLAVAYPDRVARIVVLDTVLDPREVWMNDSWVRIREWIERTEDMPVGELMQASSLCELSADVVAAYDAPFPAPESQGWRGLMMSTPRTTEKGAMAVSEAMFGAIRRDTRPMLMFWGEQDLFLTLASGRRLASRIGRDIDHVIPDAGHALQEDQGPMIGKLIAEWLLAGA